MPVIGDKWTRWDLCDRPGCQVCEKLFSRNLTVFVGRILICQYQYGTFGQNPTSHVKTIRTKLTHSNPHECDRKCAWDYYSAGPPYHKLFLLYECVQFDLLVAKLGCFRFFEAFWAWNTNFLYTFQSFALGTHSPLLSLYTFTKYSGTLCTSTIGL